MLIKWNAGYKQTLVYIEVEGIMIKLFIGLIFIGLTATAQATQHDEEYYATQLDLLTTQLDHSVTKFLPTIQFGASVVLTHSPEST